MGSSRCTSATRRKIWLIYHIVHSRNMHFGGGKQVLKSKKIAPRTKAALELLHHRLGHRFTISLMAGDNENVWKDFELRIDSDPFCTLCQIFSMNKKARSKNPLNP